MIKDICVPSNSTLPKQILFLCSSTQACFTSTPTPSCLSFRKSEPIVPCSFLKAGSFWSRKFGARWSTSHMTKQTSEQIVEHFRRVQLSVGPPSSTMNSDKHRQSSSLSTGEGYLCQFHPQYESYATGSTPRTHSQPT